MPTLLQLRLLLDSVQAGTLLFTYNPEQIGGNGDPIFGLQSLQVALDPMPDRHAELDGGLLVDYRADDIEGLALRLEGSVPRTGGRFEALDTNRDALYWRVDITDSLSLVVSSSALVDDLRTWRVEPTRGRRRRPFVDGQLGALELLEFTRAPPPPTEVLGVGTGARRLFPGQARPVMRPSLVSVDPQRGIGPNVNDPMPLGPLGQCGCQILARSSRARCLVSCPITKR